MAKKTLGDNPFEPDPQPATGSPADRPSLAGEPHTPAKGEPAGASASADGAKASRADAGTGTDRDAGTDADTDAHGDARTDVYKDAEGLGDDMQVPDAADLPTDWEAGGWEAGGWDEQARGWDAPGWESAEDTDMSMYQDDDFVLGGEAAVPDREYGPPINSVLPDPRAITREIIELERRVRSLLTPVFPIEPRRHLPLEFVWKRYRNLAMHGRADTVDDYGRDPVYMARYEPLLDFLYKRYFRVAVQGVENIPHTGRALLVANHACALPYDALVLMHAIRHEHPARRDARPLIEDSTFHFPYAGTFMSRMGGVRACPENAERLLEDGQPVIAFPEGTKGMGKLFKDRYKLQRFGRGGFIKLALRTRSPIVPVAIVGAEESLPMLGKITWFAKSVGIPYIPITPTFPFLGPLGLLPLPTKWFIRFGPVIDVAASHGPEAAHDRLLVNRLADRVRGTIQEMIDDLVAKRRSVVFG